MLNRQKSKRKLTWIVVNKCIRCSCLLFFCRSANLSRTDSAPESVPPLIYASCRSRAQGCAGRRPAEVREIRTGILLPAVSPISQRKPDYIKSLNPGLRPKPAVQVLSRRRRGRQKIKLPRLTAGFNLTLMSSNLSRLEIGVSGKKWLSLQDFFDLTTFIRVSLYFRNTEAFLAQ